MLSGCMLSAVMLSACGGASNNNATQNASNDKQECCQEFCNGVNPADFDATINGKKTGLYTLKNAKTVEKQGKTCIMWI